ncbi:IPTL-CTERM sorting domain-containing protein [Ottowia sp.]|uniref:IPTL-CTERM sorting domain-containing protein n=1 Tax=Ottowia sp. TaxID=1898956 RepID=UPI002CF3B411|nr:IPTL-CTERM sorting domain-containing protein [Ottowia sp.]HPZ56772.1 IPTL-CTERM sorting domain-containing protein [Ottowia sp.]HQD47963.1 IPTL-CTERM sorting domain-containing protein [Ottowia sp.]
MYESMSMASRMNTVALGDALRRGLAGAVICAALTPAVSFAQDGTTAIFGDAAISVMSIGDVDLSGNYDPPGMPLSGGLALTCANASASAAQLNSGRIDPPGALFLPGLQMANMWTDVNFLDLYAANVPNLLPFREFDIEGASAPLAPTAWTTGDTRVWADAPAGSRWIYPLFNNEPAPIGPETLVSVYFGGWYIPTVEEARKMRVRLTYRADDQLVAVYLNDMLKRNNLLATPITRDTSSVGTEPGVVELSGFVQGVNLLSLVVHSTQGPNQAANYQGIAVAFDAYCYTPTVTVAKTVVAPAGDAGRFTLKVNDNATPNLADGGKTSAVPIEMGAPVTVTELADAGTRMDDYQAALVCRTDQGVIDTVNGNFTMPDRDVNCTFTNTRKAAPPPPAVTPVPTLSEWSLMLMGLLAAGLGMRQVRRPG